MSEETEETHEISRNVTLVFRSKDKNLIDKFAKRPSEELAEQVADAVYFDMGAPFDLEIEGVK